MGHKAPAMSPPSLALVSKPPWLKKRIDHRAMAPVRRLVRRRGLHTVCEEARCPNIGECWARQTATFMILGDVCTRGCAFCSVKTGTPDGVERGEPVRVATAARELGLAHVVVTSVNRDDLADGGAGIFSAVVEALHGQGQTVEVLTPDFLGVGSAIDRVACARPEIYGHNVETVPRLYGGMRPQADYERSLAVLARVKERYPGILTKSGLMVGVGERPTEVLSTMEDLRSAGCDIFTVGQYLAPGGRYHPVKEYVSPDTFERYRKEGEAMGFLAVASGPFVRSSYNAEAIWERLRRSRPVASGGRGT